MKSSKVTITVGELDIWEKLAAIQKIDPAVSGGIDSVVLGRLPQVRGKPIEGLVTSGYEEIHVNATAHHGPDPTAPSGSAEPSGATPGTPARSVALREGR
jgi:hypothetical protein